MTQKPGIFTLIDAKKPVKFCAAELWLLSRDCRDPMRSADTLKTKWCRKLRFWLATLPVQDDIGKDITIMG